MSKKLMNNIKDFIEKNKDENDILNKIHELVNSNDPTNRTIVNRYSKVKKYIRENYDQFNLEFLNKIKPTRDIIDFVVSADNEKRKMKQTLKFNKGDVDKILSLKDSNKLIDLLVFLQFICGRRINEVVEPEFVLTLKPKTNDAIYFSSLSKQREPKRTLVKLVTDNISPKDFKNLLQKTRDKIKDLNLTLNDLNQKVNKQLKKMFNNNVNSSHNLRGMYGLYKYEQSGKEQNINGFLTDILNHDSTDASLNYSNYIYEV